MKTFIITIMALTFSIQSLCQKHQNIIGYSIDSSSNFIIINTDDYKGAIIPQEIKTSFNQVELSNRFNLTIQDIINAENALAVNYKKLDDKHPDIQGFDKKRKIQKHLKQYIRQYLGYLNENNERIVWIHLVQIKNLKKSIPKDWLDWQNEIIIGCGDIYYENMRTYIYNLDTKTINIW